MRVISPADDLVHCQKPEELLCAHYAILEFGSVSVENYGQTDTELCLRYYFTTNIEVWMAEIARRMTKAYFYEPKFAAFHVDKMANAKLKVEFKND